MKNPVRTGTMIALAAAGLFTAACKSSDDGTSNRPSTTEARPASGDTKAMADKSMAGDEKMARIHCQGINACKGQGGCKTAANACAGQNGCKGTGFVDVGSEDECKAKGGTVMAKM